MRIDEALAKSAELKSDSARVDVEHLLCFVLQKDPSYLRTWPEKELTAEQLSQFDSLLVKRSQGTPVAHLTGRRGFWSFDLEVNQHTLIPRPDTETLVEWALELPLNSKASVVDLGTGTGAIAIALALENPAWQVSAVEFVEEAAELARRNSVRLGASNLTVLSGSWFEPLVGQYDLIVSNPPYIDPKDTHLEEGDVRFEPLTALTAEDEGLADLFYIIETAPAYLKGDGWLLLEHGYDQAGQVVDKLKQVGFEEVETRQDYGGNPRITGGCWRV
ncbi:Release factor glutamine methyltransferase [Marinobacterium sp. xm-a-121]|uniref:peptide chain release factor N(5)-glutamine methyltransferase n=1 Tax=unclassified Marinobacterium TaxID=2644139 RepID=UPI001568111F|nr:MULTISPECIES: peptide chain release factor N(5)-glutamine methyltransferase [unclassified Marinobacterium]NRP37957.1 Release factor glutamine methyltransferase [Marinobacterium sp. xm-a-121]NRP99209.1 Release factor glutamine methyltransferase [Marinobacterium sp. xm-v-233]